MAKYDPPEKPAAGCKIASICLECLCVSFRNGRPTTVGCAGEVPFKTSLLQPAHDFRSPLLTPERSCLLILPETESMAESYSGCGLQTLCVDCGSLHENRFCVRHISIARKRASLHASSLALQLYLSPAAANSDRIGGNDASAESTGHRQLAPPSPWSGARAEQRPLGPIHPLAAARAVNASVSCVTSRSVPPTTYHSQGDMGKGGPSEYLLEARLIEAS